MTIEKVEAKVGYSMKKALKEENIYMDHESQIKAIEKTFADAKKPIVEHSSKKGVTAVEVLPVIPDFKVILLIFQLSLFLFSCNIFILFDSCGSTLALKLSSTQILPRLNDPRKCR